jgi:hypothetical protein
MSATAWAGIRRLAVAFSFVAWAQPVATPALPLWLQDRIANYENSRLGSVPDRIWQFEYRGQTVYYFSAPCCDQFDELYDASGTYLCAPSGGYTGLGDLRCPDAVSDSLKMNPVWQDARLIQWLPTFYLCYMAAWMLACGIAVYLYRHNPATYALSRPEYRRFLFVPWKLATFVIATTGITLIAPYVGNPAWDSFAAFIMALLTYWSAPWVVGVLYRTGRGMLPLRHLYVAVCLWMFSASWSHDLYIVLRGGYYPNTWLSNMFATSVLYLSAGLLWNLDWIPNRGMTFSFMESDWPPQRPVATVPGVFWLVPPLMLGAAVAIWYVVISRSF